MGARPTARRHCQGRAGRPSVRRSRRLGLLLFAACLSLLASSTWAKGRKSRPKPVASQLAARPSDAEPSPAGEAGGPDYAELSRQVESAYRSSPAPELLYELAVLANLSGRRVEAHDLMRRFLADPLSVPGSHGWAEAEQLVGQPRPPAGEVQVVADDEGLIVADGQLLGALPLSLPLLLPVGRHQIRLEMQGKTMGAAVDILDGRAVELRFNRASGAVVVTLPPAAILLSSGGATSLPPDLWRRVQETTSKALQRARLALYDREAALRRVPNLASCLSTLPCQAQLAVRSDVEYLLTMTFPPAVGDGELRLRLGLVDAEVAAEAAGTELRCPRCTPDQLLGRLSEALARLIKEGAGRGRGVLIVRSNPVGAEVRWGEQVLGQTPYQHAAFAGSLTLRLNKPGFAPVSRDVIVTEGKPATLEVALEPVAAPPVSPVPPPAIAASPTAPAAGRPRWRLVTGAVTLAVGLGLVGLGISGVAVDGQCVVPPQPPMLNCRDRFDTLGKGAVLIGVGSGLSLAGVVLMAWPPGRAASAGRTPP